MAVGQSISGLSMGLYSFDVSSQGLTNRAFSDVRADGATYCYERFLEGQSAGGMPLRRPNGVVLMSMTDNATLKVELAAGTACGASPRSISSNATTFER
jgi:hypothetical protein